MSATAQRDRAADLAKRDPHKALEEARQVSEPWFRAQALSWVARFTDGDTVSIAQEAAKSAEQCKDDYQKSAVRAWEIAALAERGFTSEARNSLNQALTLSACAEPMASRAEALLLLLEAALRVNRQDASRVYARLKNDCSMHPHWRCERAIRHGEKLLSGEVPYRLFFW